MNGTRSSRGERAARRAIIRITGSTGDDHFRTRSGSHPRRMKQLPECEHTVHARPDTESRVAPATSLSTTLCSISTKQRRRHFRNSARFGCHESALRKLPSSGSPSRRRVIGQRRWACDPESLVRLPFRSKQQRRTTTSRYEVMIMKSAEVVRHARAGPVRHGVAAFAGRACGRRRSTQLVTPGR